jgi:CubicO group peptidase (beta-lactamase class C family)
MTRTPAASLLLTGALLLSPSAGADAQVALTDSTRIALNRVFAAWTATDGPGCALGVSQGGHVIFQNGYGMANLELDVPITPASIFHVASVSKQFTATAVMLLLRDGKLSIDEDIRTWVPELPDFGHRITLRHLLTHTSGLRDQWDLLFMARGRFEENRISEDDVLEIIGRQRELNFAPGTEYLYSNTGYTLAGTIVRRVSGRSLREFAEERIFAPLGMTNTHFHDDYTMIVKGRAAGYARRPGGWRVSLPNYDTYGATSLFTTVGDLLRWVANLADPRVGDAALISDMLASATLTGGDTTGYGFGISTERYRGARLIGHGGADAGYRTFLGIFPEHRTGIAVLCNASTANPAQLTRDVADVLLGTRLAPKSADPPPRVRLSAEQLRRFAGVYAHPVTGAPTFITLRGDTLVVGRSGGPALIPIAARRFRVAGAQVEVEFTPAGELLQYPLSWPPRTPVRLDRRAAATPTSFQLAEYAGSYHSEELGATYSVTAMDSLLVLRTRGSAERRVFPAYGDTFIGDYRIDFIRDAEGRITGMLMGSGRVRGVRFTREGP